MSSFKLIAQETETFRQIPRNQTTSTTKRDITRSLMIFLIRCQVSFVLQQVSEFRKSWRKTWPEQEKFFLIYDNKGDRISIIIQIIFRDWRLLGQWKRTCKLKRNRLAWPLVWLVAYNLLSWSELLTNRAIRFSHLATLFSVHENHTRWKMKYLPRVIHHVQIAYRFKKKPSIKGTAIFWLKSNGSKAMNTRNFLSL